MCDCISVDEEPSHNVWGIKRLYFMEFHLGAVFISTASAVDHLARLTRSRGCRLSREDTECALIVFVTPSLDVSFHHLCNIIHILIYGVLVSLSSSSCSPTNRTHKL